MPLTPEEKEQLADRIVEVLRDEDPKARMSELERAVKAGEEGKDGMNSVVLAVAAAMLKRAKKMPRNSNAD